MRRAFNSSIWRAEDGSLIALNLGADYCAEHEWGISGILQKFGIKQDKLGIAGRTITKGGDSIITTSENVDSWSREKKTDRAAKQVYGITFALPYSSGNDFSWLIKGAYWEPEKTEMLAYWSDSRFLALLENENEVRLVQEAFINNDIAFWIGGGGPFQNGGLCIALVSKLPEDFKQSMLDADNDTIVLKKAAKATGIEKILEKADCKYYALSPRWKDEDKKEVKFWLNPQEQDKYQYGWYSVNELKQWTKGEGPIVEKAKV
jgi:hypothetical protein